MVDRFVPCVSCARHIKAGDAACPFCGAATPETTATASALTNPLSRAAVLFVGLTTAAACGGETNSPPSNSSSSSASSSGTTSTTSSASSSGTVPEPTAVPMYGPAPQPTHTTSGAVPAYGAAPVFPDAGKL